MEVGLLDDVRERNLVLISQSIIDCAAIGELKLGPKAEKRGQTCLRIKVQDQDAVTAQGIPLCKMDRCCRF